MPQIGEDKQTDLAVEAPVPRPVACLRSKGTQDAQHVKRNAIRMKTREMPAHAPQMAADLRISFEGSGAS
jgi:hypothetical protein